MHKFVTILGLVLISSSAFAGNIECSLQVIHDSLKADEAVQLLGEDTKTITQNSLNVIDLESAGVQLNVVLDKKDDRLLMFLKMSDKASVSAQGLSSQGVSNLTLRFGDQVARAFCKP